MIARKLRQLESYDSSRVTSASGIRQLGGYDSSRAMANRELRQLQKCDSLGVTTNRELRQLENYKSSRATTAWKLGQLPQFISQQHQMMWIALHQKFRSFKKKKFRIFSPPLTWRRTRIVSKKCEWKTSTKKISCYFAVVCLSSTTFTVQFRLILSVD